MDLTVKLWDPATGNQLAVLPAGERNPNNGAVHRQFYVRGLAFSPDSRSLVTRGWNAKLWEVSTGKERFALATTTMASALAFSTDGTLLAEGGYGLRLWDGETGDHRKTLLPGFPHHVNLLAFSPDGRLLLSAGSAQAEPTNHADLILWDVRNGKIQSALAKEFPSVQYAEFSGDGKLIVAAVRVAAAERSLVKGWETETGKERFTLEFDEYQIDKMSVSPDNRCLATLTWKGRIRIWDLPEGRERAVTIPARPGTHSFVFSPDGRLLGITRTRWQGEDRGYEPSLELIDPGTGRELASRRLGLRSLSGIWSHLNNLNLIFSRDGKHLAVGLRSGEVHILNVDWLLRQK